MKSTIDEIRNLSKEIERKRLNHQKSQEEEKLKSRTRLQNDALKNRNKIRREISSSGHVRMHNIISGIRFDFIGVTALYAIMIAMGIHLYRQGVIGSPFERSRYDVKTVREDDSKGVKDAVEKLVSDMKADKESSLICGLFEIGNSDKVQNFMRETASLDVRTVVYAKNEKCYYASATTDKDQNVSFKLDHLSGDFKISSISIED